MSKIPKIVRHIMYNVSKEDLKRFDDFIKSPYFNKRHEPAELLNKIVELKDPLENIVDRQELAEVFYPDLKLTPKSKMNKMAKEMTYLKALFHQFLACQQLQKRTYLEHILNMEAAKENKWLDILEDQSKKLKKKLDKCKSHNSDYYFAKYKHDYLYYFGTKDRPDLKELEELFDELNDYYFSTQLKHSCEIISYISIGTTFKKDYNLKFFEKAVKYIQNNWSSYEGKSVIALYFKVLKTMRNGKTLDGYHELKKFLSSAKVSIFEAEELRNLYFTLINYCIEKINIDSERDKYRRELFDLYKLGLDGKKLDDKILFEEGYLPERFYKNIVTLGCVLEEYSWTKKFLEDYWNKLEPANRDNVYYFNLGVYYSSRGQNDKALLNLKEVKFTDIVYSITTKFLLLKIYYGNEDTEASLSLIDSFRIFVTRKMPQKDKKKYYNFLNFTKKLILLRSERSTYSAKDYEKNIKDQKQKIVNSLEIVYRGWLLKKCEEELIVQN